jgi:DNA helicase-2/ATP-dependent DNA helicase PcrA
MLLDVQQSDIEYAEQILFGRTGCFDQQRIDFLKDFGTIDVQAVPGSGKTTVLLAKLLILERHLPLTDGAGVAVLSHTNVAVEEIASRIKVHCPKLFEYPNFIGTIQSFVDHFLAMPFYEQHYRSATVRIDNEIYEQVYINNLGYCLPGKQRDIYNKVLHIKGANAALLLQYRFERINGKTILVKALNKESLLLSKPKGRTKPANYRDWSGKEKMAVEDYLKAMKTLLLSRGILHFDDAYFLASCYLQKIPTLPSLFKSRFPYVFVDEMQDMETHQYAILEKLFFDKDANNCFQRIGDVNQCIFGEHNVGGQLIWTQREKILEINGSHRLAPRLSNILCAFGAKMEVKVAGLRSCGDLGPHLIAFKEESINKVIGCFGDLILQYRKEGKMAETSVHPIKAIGWNGKESEEKKIRISDYYSDYSSNSKAKQIDHESFQDYLDIQNIETPSFAVARKQILNAILKLLRLMVNLPPGTHESKRKFVNFMKFNWPDQYDELLISIYLSSADCLKSDPRAALSRLSGYLPAMIKCIFNVDLSERAKEFLNAPMTFIKNKGPKLNLNLVCHKGIMIDVGTVHSVKGETHMATLYLDTCYHEVESIKSIGQLKGENAVKLKSVRKLESAMMMYVGFSRATDLLCYAAPIENISGHEKELEDRGWRIITI